MNDKKNIPEEFSSLGEIDRLVHEPARLLLLSCLYVLESADFVFLLNQTGLTRGNLSTHMSKLEDAGYIMVNKEFVDKRPLTMLAITEQGRSALLDYREAMQQVLDGID